MNALRLLLSAASTFVVVGCARHEVQPAEVLPAVEVRTARVQLEVWPVEFPTHGTVRAVQRAAIAAKVAGSIATLSLAIGQAVQAGDVLLTISAVELIARVAQVKAQLAQTERELARERTLESAGAGTLDTVKTLADRLAHGQAALREAETLRDYATVRAPFAGVVTKKFVEVGDFAAPGVPLLQLDETDIAGVYDARIGDDAVPALRFATQSDPAESRLEELSPADLKVFDGVAQIIRWSPEHSLRTALQKERTGSEFWLAVAILALVLAVAETWFGNRWSRSK